MLIDAANHVNDTCFGNGLVMGFAHCINYADLVKTLEKFKRNLGPLPDTLQAGACVFPPFWKSRYHVVLYSAHVSCPSVPAYGSICVVLPLFCFRSAPSTFPQKTGHLSWGYFLESLVFRLHSKIGQIHLSIEAQCELHTYSG